MDQVDFCIVGAGVIGLACARELALRHGDRASIVLLEQGDGIGQQISSRNSEVIHAGIYYPTGSLKAELCVRGRELLYAYCREQDVAHRRLGKLIVAQKGEEAELERIHAQAVANGVDTLQPLDDRQLRAVEPGVRAAAALLSPDTGIVDSHELMQSLLHQAQRMGVELALLTRLDGVAADPGKGFVLSMHSGQEQQGYELRCTYLVNAAGLHAQDVARSIAGLPPQVIPPLYPCKGDYFLYAGKSPISHLVYPVPERNLQGLGVHCTLDMGMQLRFGPDSNYIDTIDYAVDPSKASVFAQAVARYLPDIDVTRLVPGYAGIRPKLAAAGQAQADFCIQGHDNHGLPGLVNLFGIESPGLTSALAIAEVVADSL